MVLNVSSRVLDSLTRPHSLHVYHRQQQPLRQDTHPCQDQPPYCDHVITPSLPSTPNNRNIFQFCIPTKSSPFYHCVCQTGFRLTGDGHCALLAADRDHGDFLLFSQNKPGMIRGVATELRDGTGAAEEVRSVSLFTIIIKIIIIITFSSWFRSMVLTEPVPLISIMLRMTFISPTHSQTRQLSHNLLRFGEQQFWRKLFILRTF